MAGFPTAAEPQRVAISSKQVRTPPRPSRRAAPGRRSSAAAAGSASRCRAVPSPDLYRRTEGRQVEAAWRQKPAPGPRRSEPSAFRGRHGAVQTSTQRCTVITKAQCTVITTNTRRCTAIGRAQNIGGYYTVIITVNTGYSHPTVTKQDTAVYVNSIAQLLWRCGVFNP